MRIYATLMLLSLLLSSCGTYNRQEVIASLPESSNTSSQPPSIDSAPNTAEPAQRVLKRKIAVARFTNEAKYGSGLFADKNHDRIGKQASDILSSALTKSGKFIVLERPDLNRLEAESELVGLTPEEFRENLVGVDALLLGSIVEFGRKDTGEVILFSRSREQLAHAKINIRLVDPRTGHVFFSEDGSGEALLDSVTIDSTLDKALSAAVANLLDKLINKLSDKPWTSGVLSADNNHTARFFRHPKQAETDFRNKVLISGGKRQGLKVGDRLLVMVPGKVTKSPQTGFKIQLPHKQVGELEIEEFFGYSETNEGSICHVVEGDIPNTDHIIQFK